MLPPIGICGCEAQLTGVMSEVMRPENLRSRWLSAVSSGLLWASISS